VKFVSAIIVSFAAGLAVSHLPLASATVQAPDLSKKRFSVSIDEVKQNFVFAEKFSGSYTKTVTMSDGSKREIQLTPMVRDGMQVVRLKDTGGETYVSFSGTTTNGNLMIQLLDDDAQKAALKAQGWKF
jgi:hypothetical protein